MNTAVKYDPNGLLDEVKRRKGLKNDAALAAHFNTYPPLISKLRHMTLRVGSVVVLKCIEYGDMSLAEVRAYVGGAA